MAKLTDVLTPVAALVTAVGALAATGTIGRMQRDHPAWTAVAFGLVIVASGVWLAGSYLGNHETAQTVLRLIAAGVFAAGAVLAIVLAIKAAGAQPRPRVEASLSPDRSTVRATVNASDLKSKQRLAILIDALNNGAVRSHLYQAYIGGDSDGNVKQMISVKLPRTVTDVGVKAFTNKLSPKCDDLAPETQPEAEQKQERARKSGSTPVEQETQKQKGSKERTAQEADPGSGTGCVILSVATP